MLRKVHPHSLVRPDRQADDACTRSIYLVVKFCLCFAGVAILVLSVLNVALLSATTSPSRKLQVARAADIQHLEVSDVILPGDDSPQINFPEDLTVGLRPPKEVDPSKEAFLPKLRARLSHTHTLTPEMKEYQRKKASHDTLRTVQGPFYWQCYSSPQLILKGRNVTCSDLLEVSWEWRSAETTQVDSSRCQFYLSESEVANSMLNMRTVHLRPLSTDHVVFKQIYCGADFTYLQNINKYLPVSDPGISILDAGANVGLASLLFLMATRFHGQVLAVDAHPNTVQVLDKNVAAAGGRIQTLQAAIVTGPVSRDKKTMQFVGSANEYWGFRVEHEERIESSDRVVYDVPTKSLMDLAAMVPSKKFDWIKLDIEGEEKHLLLDPQSRIVLCQATCIMLELHEWFQPGSNAAFDDFLANGCKKRAPYRHITSTGEYLLYCRND